MSGVDWSTLREIATEQFSVASLGGARMSAQSLVGVLDYAARIEAERPTVLIALDVYETVAAMIDEYYPSVPYGWSPYVPDGTAIVWRVPLEVVA